MAIDLMDELMNGEASYDAAAAENAAKYAGMVPPGEHQAELDGVSNKEIGESKVTELEFKIVAGPSKGMKVRYTLFTSVKETDKDGRQRTPEELEQAKNSVKNNFWTTAAALGLAKKVTKDGKASFVKTEGKHDFKDCRGTQCIVKTKVRKYVDRRDGTEKTTSEVAMFGVLPLGSRPVVGGGSAPAKAPDLADIF